MPTIRIATRSSPLALWQTRHVALRLRQAHPSIRVQLVQVSSSGDKDRTTPLHQMGGIGIFTAAVQEAVLAGEADCAVHSCKDLPTLPVEGLAPAVIVGRADVRDVLIGVRRMNDLPTGALVGTSSLRRRHQLASIRPDLRFEDLRGNVARRIAAVTDGHLDATILAAAGLMRLGLLRNQACAPLAPDILTPAPAQGAVAVDYRQDDTRTARYLADLQDWQASLAVAAERRILAKLGGGCSLPFGCLVTRSRTTWTALARLADGDTTTTVSGQHADLNKLEEQVIAQLPDIPS